MICYNKDEIDLKFETSDGVFSPTAIDKGTLSMLETVEFSKDDKVLDLGCGYGFVGIYASCYVCDGQIVMSDVSDEALRMTECNIELNAAKGIKLIKSYGLDSIDDNDFTKILANPPYHEDFSVPKNYIEKGYKKLCIGGKMYMVTKRKDWYKNKFIAVFGGVRIEEINGYYIFIAEKRENKKKPVKDAKKQHLSKKLARKYGK